MVAIYSVSSSLTVFFIKISHIITFIEYQIAGENYMFSRSVQPYQGSLIFLFES